MASLPLTNEHTYSNTNQDNSSSQFVSYSCGTFAGLNLREIMGNIEVSVFILLSYVFD